MSRFALSPLAEQDIKSILRWTHENFGAQTRQRYEALLTQAILDVVNDPLRSGSQERNEIGQSIRTFHLNHSRKNVDPSIGRVKKPRHFLVYRIVGEDVVEIVRVLHDSMDLKSQVPSG